MKKFLLLFLSILIILISVFPAGATETKTEDFSDKVLVCDKSGGRILLFDINKPFSEENILFSFSASEKNGFKKDEILEFSDAKLSYSEYFESFVITACASNNFACIVSYPDGKLLWSTRRTPENPCFVELLPNGRVCVSSKDGNCFRVYSSENLQTTCSSTDFTLDGANGLYFDEKTSTLWTLGRKNLDAYLFENGELSLNEEKSVSLPSFGGCDIYPISNTENFWVTAGITVFIFNPNEKTFVSDYAGVKGISKKGTTQSISSFSDSNKVLTVVPNNAHGITNATNYLSVITPIDNKKFEGEEISLSFAASRARLVKEKTLVSKVTFSATYPAVEGLEDGAIYEDYHQFSVNGAYFEKLLINGKEVTPESDGTVLLTSEQENYQISVFNISGKETTFTVTVEKSVDIVTIIIAGIIFAVILIIILVIILIRKGIKTKS